MYLIVQKKKKKRKKENSFTVDSGNVDFLRRVQYRKDAQNAYQQRMLEAHAGQGDFPRVRTFRQLDSSTNNVFDDLKEAERWTGVQGKVDMAELTWEQRERILRLMFAKMNGFKEKRFDVCLSYSLWQFLFVFFFSWTILSMFCSKLWQTKLHVQCRSSNDCEQADRTPKSYFKTIENSRKKN